MKSQVAAVLWFTGLSGSGKTTISIVIKIKLEGMGKRVGILDGDSIRKIFHSNLGFSRDDIRKNNRLTAELAKDRLNYYDFILISMISPYREDRMMVKKIIGSNNFIEIFVNTPIEECMRRDPKGLYRKAINGEINDFIGISDLNPYEEPLYPQLKVDTTKLSIEEISEKIVNYLTMTGRLD